MKLLVASDTHGNSDSLHMAIAREKPDALVFLGDGWRDIPEDMDGVKLYQVLGNCDDYYCGPAETLLLEIEGVRIFIAHGHTYKVKQTMMYIHLAALEQKADLVLYGHTHLQYLDDELPYLTLFNPGSLGQAPHRYGIVILRDGKFVCRECSLD